MKLSELPRRIRTINVGDIVAWKHSIGRYLYTRVVSVNEYEVCGWWYDQKDTCNAIGDDEIGACRPTKECELV